MHQVLLREKLEATAIGAPCILHSQRKQSPIFVKTPQSSRSGGCGTRRGTRKFQAEATDRVPPPFKAQKPPKDPSKRVWRVGEKLKQAPMLLCGLNQNAVWFQSTNFFHLDARSARSAWSPTQSTIGIADSLGNRQRKKRVISRQALRTHQILLHQDLRVILILELTTGSSLNSYSQAKSARAQGSQVKRAISLQCNSAKENGASVRRVPLAPNLLVNCRSLECRLEQRSRASIGLPPKGLRAGVRPCPPNSSAPAEG